MTPRLPRIIPGTGLLRRQSPRCHLPFSLFSSSLINTPSTSSSSSSSSSSPHNHLLVPRRLFSNLTSSPQYLGTTTDIPSPPEDAPSSNKPPVPMPVLNKDNINPHLLRAEYAVRGEIATKSESLRHDLTTSPGSLPFNEIISANIGNPQQLDQKPITFFRQVLSILEYPALLELAPDLFPEDVKERARTLLKDVQSVGAYSQSQGALGIRKSVADFISKRDGFPADPADIFLTAGASAGVNTLLSTIVSGPETGILIPVPQYPLYTATLALLNAAPIPYYLDERSAWSTNTSELRDIISKARSKGTDPRCIVIINPGNPTGATLAPADIDAVLTLAAEERLVVMADEVYQTNVYTGEFHSFKSRLRTLEQQDEKFKAVELISLHSTSKGMVGECGHRGGYFELTNFDPLVKAQIYKLVSITLCPPVIGQCLVELMVNPPAPGSPSHALYEKEYNAIFNGLKQRSQALFEAFKDMTGVECQEPMGAMYLFPTIKLPERACEEARKMGRSPDEWYCLRMLEETGVCVVPGSGFGQKEGEWHFRTTFLAPGTEWVGRVKRFHEGFMKEWK